VAASTFWRSRARGVDAALDHFGDENFEDGFEMRFVAGEDGDEFILDVEVFDFGGGAAEVEAVGQFALRLHDGVVHFVHVDVADDVEGVIGGHGGILLGEDRSRKSEDRS